MFATDFNPRDWGTIQEVGHENLSWRTANGWMVLGTVQRRDRYNVQAPEEEKYLIALPVDKSDWRAMCAAAVERVQQLEAANQGLTERCLKAEAVSQLGK